MDEASDVLLALRPVTFRFKPEIDKEHKKTEKLEATVASLIATVKEQAAQHGAGLGRCTVKFRA
jgi:hypothetical protein